MKPSSASAVPKRQTFVLEALILSVSNLLVKLIGVLFKIPVANMLDTNMGIFNAAYSIYAMLYMVSTAGMPVAISRMISASVKRGRRVEVERIYAIGIMIFGAIGLFFTFLLFLGADWIAEITKHADAALAMKIISPTLFLVCIASAIRGYFQGQRIMFPTAFSQFIEAAIKLIVGLLGVSISTAMGASPAVCAAFGILGITVGMIFSTAFLFFCKIVFEKIPRRASTNECAPPDELLRSLLRIAIPVTITSSALYLSQFLDTLVISRCLIGSGMAESTADAVYASYTTLALSISDLLPSTLVYPIAISILPAVSAAIAARNRKEANGYIHDSIRITGIIAFPCAFGLFAVARPAISLLYGANWGNVITLWGYNYHPIDFSYRALQILAVGIIFISLLSTTNALLQACGKSFLPMFSVGLGVLFLIAIEITLVSVRSIGIFGAPIASVVCYAVALMLNFYFIRKYQHFPINFPKLFLKPFICSLLCGGAALLVVKICENLFQSSGRLISLLTLVLAAAVGSAVYTLSLIVCKGITRNEVLMLPKGRTMLAFLQRKNLI